MYNKLLNYVGKIHLLYYCDFYVSTFCAFNFKKYTCKNYTLVQAHILFMEILLNIKFPLFFLRKIYNKRCCGSFVKNVPSDKKMK